MFYSSFIWSLELGTSQSPVFYLPTLNLACCMHAYKMIEQLQIAIRLLHYVLQCYNAPLLVLPFKFYVVLLLLVYIWMLC